MLTGSSQGTLGSGFINIPVIPSDIKIFSISCDFYYLLFSLFLSSPTFGRSGLFCQAFSRGLETICLRSRILIQNLPLPGHSLSRQTQRHFSVPVCFCSLWYVALLTVPFLNLPVDLSDVTLLVSSHLDEVTFRLVCSVSFMCPWHPRSSWLRSLPASELQEGKSGDKELVRKLLQQASGHGVKWQWEWKGETNGRIWEKNIRQTTWVIIYVSQEAGSCWK